MKKNKYNGLLTALVMIVLGVILALYPGDTVVTILRILGIGLLAVGAVGVIVWLLQKDKEKRSPWKLVIPAIEIVAGIIVLANPSFVLSIYPVVVGILIALDGIMNLIAAISMKRKGLGGATLAIILSLVTIVLGVLIVCNPFATVSMLVRVMGIVMIYDGVSGIIIHLADR